jgi:hypothetical protein
MPEIIPRSSADLTLWDATVQEIQLELLRRTSFNALDGPRVVDSLLRNHELWLAFMLDRLWLDMKRRLPGSGLIKLRDLPDNLWNADTLYILCPNATAAHRLAAIMEEEDWAGMATVYDDRKEVDSALGTGGDDYALVAVWWD